MGVNQPLISVVMTTYNHEKYIDESIRSVLEQTFSNFEFIIVNDGSTDNTDKIIQSYLNDNRIIYIFQENQGPSAAVNQGILKANGKYIALMSGDDICYPERLQKQYNYSNLEATRIIFSWVDFIDDDSNQLASKHFAKNFFNATNKTRAEILKSLFFNGNYLCSVTAFIEKNILLEAGLFNLSSIQLQDFDMWIKLVKKYEISVIPEKLVKYRIRNDSKNLSHPNNNYLRSGFESCQIYRNFFDDVSIELFKESFRDKIKNNDFHEGIEYELEKAFLYLNSNFIYVRNIGAEKLFYLLQNHHILAIAKENYSFGLTQLYELTNDIDNLNGIFSKYSTRFYKIYKLWINLARLIKAKIVK
ncbi:glycosyltransferase family 2 protein [Okeanomitos corallinicola TIOX110]|uniref:Glycosyltransferase family 2 protein n=1 Tax=Okeanomitos corallinicola TIOX110 TaxID=3133117 RepID=A0ABZ2UU41_9CYAN